MSTTTEINRSTTVAARVAGEDITRGDFVTIINETFELPSFLWDRTDISLSPDEPIRIQYKAGNAGLPQKVVGVCLPFVYARKPNGVLVTIDMRRQQLVRLDHDCAQTVWDELKQPKRKKKRK